MLTSRSALQVSGDRTNGPWPGLLKGWNILTRTGEGWRIIQVESEVRSEESKNMAPSVEKRKRSNRVVAFLTVALSEGEAHYVVDTENVSDTGLCLCPKKLFPVGTHLHLIFGQPPELPSISTDGVVRWFEGGKGVGVEFTSLSDEHREALAKFVAPHPDRRLH